MDTESLHQSPTRRDALVWTAGLALAGCASAPKEVTPEEIARLRRGPGSVPATDWLLLPKALSGWNEQRLQLADELAKSMGTTAYMVVHRGELIHEFGATRTPSLLHSARKGVMALLYGFAVDRGKINLNTTMAQLGMIDRERLTPQELSATIKNLLQSRSGIYLPAAAEAPIMASTRPARGSRSPGTHWYYNNWDFNVLGTIFTMLNGEDVFTALTKDIAQPLGFQDYSQYKHTTWQFEREKSIHPAYHMRLSTRDMARIGLLVARKGRWGDSRLVSERWIDEMTTGNPSPSNNPSMGYCWLEANATRMGSRRRGKAAFTSGAWGQYIYVDFSGEIVIAHKVNSDLQSRIDMLGDKFLSVSRKIYEAAPS